MKYCTDDGKHIFNTEEEVFDFERKNVESPTLECQNHIYFTQTDVWIEPKFDRYDNMTDFELINFDSQINRYDNWDNLILFYICSDKDECFDNVIYTDKQIVAYINDNCWDLPTFAENYPQGTIHIRMIRKL